jgi:hypothetical protein
VKLAELGIIVFVPCVVVAILPEAKTAVGEPGATTLMTFYCGNMNSFPLV